MHALPSNLLTFCQSILHKAYCNAYEYNCPCYLSLEVDEP